MRYLLLFAMACSLCACRHPLEIRGQGSIVERIYGERGCSYTEFLNGNARCTDNRVQGGRYLVSYEAVPEPGWRFSHWEGLKCDKQSIAPYCEFDIPESAVIEVNRTRPDFTAKATVAVFVRVQPSPAPAGIDSRLRAQINALRLTGEPRSESVPAIRSPLAQLGMRLFFSRSLSGNFDTACATCHHPALAGADGLSLPIGTRAVQPEVVGPDRRYIPGAPAVPRNSPTTFNSGLYETSLFWDGRVGRLLSGAITTPDSRGADPDAGDTLLAAQARFPVTVPEELLGHDWLPGAEGNEIRTRIAQRIGDYGAGAGEIENNNWLPLFREAFGDELPVQELVTYDNIALALGEYQRSQTFVNTPWKAYVEGDYSAISNRAKQGASVFFEDPPSIDPTARGAGCAFCHEGDFFTEEASETVAFPQIGPGRGSIRADTDDDVGVELVFSNPANRYRFRTPSLINVTETAPYGHTGSYGTLEEVVRHYAEPDDALADYFSQGGWCQLEQFADLPNCAGLYPHARANTRNARQKVVADNEEDRGAPDIRISDNQVQQIIAFLETLTDPCVRSRECLSPWIPDAEGAPDAHQLNAVDAQGRPL